MKTFYNNAIIGNTKFLATLDDKSQFLRIFWPSLDYNEQIEIMKFAIQVISADSRVVWLNDFQSVQEYVENTNILRTRINAEDIGLTLELIDIVPLNENVIVRNVKITNISKEVVDFRLFLYCRAQTDKKRSCAMFDFDSDAVAFINSNNYMFVGSNIECKQFQLTNSPFEACNRGFLYGSDNHSLLAEGAMMWEFNSLESGAEINLNFYMGFDYEIKNCRKSYEKIKNISFSNIFENTKNYWREYIDKCNKIFSDDRITALYNRSLLTLSLLCHEKGGIIASAEFDEEMQKCGGYGFCWPRDGVYICEALDKAGLLNISKGFYLWLKENQDIDGSWHQRYYTNGNIAPSWGNQLDEIGIVLWGILEHYEKSNDLEFLENIWECVSKCAQYLLDNIDDKNLPKISYDLWEERRGQHVYTSASVYAGLLAAYKMGTFFNAENNIWHDKALKIKESIQELMWEDTKQRFKRSINVKLNPWGAERGTSKDIIVNKKGYRMDVSLEDYIVDASLLGLVFPFEVYDPNDNKIISTVKAIEETLISNGGVKRYEDDNYIGGNPWVITTLWLGKYYAKKGDLKAAKDLLNWVANHSTYLGLLPEQVDKNTGDAIWGIPLAWSHAMFISLVLDLYKESNII